MSEQNQFLDYVFSLSEQSFNELQEAVRIRTNKDRYGVTDFTELALKFSRVPSCPSCGSTESVSFGSTPEGMPRFQCKGCGKTYSLLSNTIFHSTKKSLETWELYLTLMTYNVPLEMTEDLCKITHPTAMLWRQKVFATVDDYQKRIKLKDRIWIDEMYIYDSSLIHEDDYQRKRGLSKDLLCIAVGIDIYKNVYVAICGHGKPSAAMIEKAFADHIEEKSVLVHDGEKAHNKLIERYQLISEPHKADIHDKTYLENMALINNLCSWIRRYVFRFVGMRIENLQSYLNWFVYLFRVKSNTDKWPKMERILRHLVLTDIACKR